MIDPNNPAESAEKSSENEQNSLAFSSEIRLSMSTARKFMFVIRLRNESEEQSFANLNRIEKAIAGQGFDVKRAAKSDIKRFLSIYLGRTAADEELPDFDGERWMISG